jgi:hypothetical protein
MASNRIGIVELLIGVVLIYFVYSLLLYATRNPHIHGDDPVEIELTRRPDLVPPRRSLLSCGRRLLESRREFCRRELGNMCATAESKDCSVVPVEIRRVICAVMGVVSSMVETSASFSRGRRLGQLKLNIASPAALIRYAVRNKLVEP